MRDRTAICGFGLTEIGSFPERTPLSLAVEAFKLALDDSGLKKDQIDGLSVLSYGSDYDRFLEATGVEARFAHQGWTHGRFIAPLVQHAALVLNAGMANYIAIVHGRRRGGFGRPVDLEMWRQGLGPHGESPAYGAVLPAYGAAMAARRYFHLYGGGSEDLAHVAVTMRNHARLNPAAMRRDPMTVEDHQKSRWIMEPLRLFDCAQNNEGGACLILTTAERARDLKKPPVYLMGMQGVHAGRQYHNMAQPGLGVAQQDTFTYKPDDDLSYRMAGITNKDVNGLVTYDAFTPFVLFTLERNGFCGPGEAMDFVRRGDIGLGGRLPTNTSGGLLSEGHVAGWNLFAELVRQLRHEAGERQIKDAKIIQYASMLGESIIFRS